ncbi:MAG: glycoside hydrolase family 140 protein [Bacteroidetes bacterium]|nr:glycoside hydrolase family 140 protein [Bacteroidota bacterium]
MKSNITSSPILLLFSVSLTAQLPSLRVSDNHRHLVTADGKPFFWLADTAWELFHRTNRQEAEVYFKKRAGQGFNVIQAVALAELDVLHTPNRNGDLPLHGEDPTKPNEAYFRYVDTLIDLAATHSLYIALLPTWGDKVFKDRWGKGPEIFNPENARVYGRWIGNRYRNRTNIIWVIGGDRDPRDGSPDVEIWQALAAGVEEGTGGGDRALMTFHPQPERIEASSSRWFHNDNWLDMNMLQTGHCDDTPVWQRMEADWERSPAKPFLNGEAIYEEMPVCFDAKNLGYASAWDVRRAAYLSVFSGACGHTYGCGPVIFFSKKGEHFFADLHAWQEALDLPAASQMKHLRTLIESRPMLERVPDQGLLADEGNNAFDRIQAARGEGYAFVYTAHGLPVTVNMGKISGKTVSAHWYDPRTGKATPIGVFDNKGWQTFAPPYVWSPVPDHRTDLVLVLDDEGKNYPVPGL